MLAPRKTICRGTRTSALLAATAVALLLAGCGATKRTVVTVAKARPKTTSATPSTTVHGPPGPSACIDFLYGHDAELEFVSTTQNVQPACESWIHNNAKQGVLWTQQTPRKIPVTSLSQVCSLFLGGGAVTASVVDDGGQFYGQAACNALIAAGWSSAPPPGAAPFKNVKPTGTTRFDLPEEPSGKYPHIEPSALAFSADGGNVVTGIVWTTWSATEAIGEGSSQLQSCIPSCVQGTEVPVNATITLLDPVAGHFTKLLEERNGTTEIASYGARSGSMNLTVGLWPWHAS